MSLALRNHELRPVVISERDAASMCNVSISHFRRLRKAGQAPRHVMLGTRRIGYRLKDVEAWIEERLSDGLAA